MRKSNKKSDDSNAKAPREVDQYGRWFSDETIVVGEPSPVVEPRPPEEVFRSHPYRPDTVIDGWSVDEFAWRGASSRGLSHRYDGVPRQDDFGVQYNSTRKHLYVVVADGVSGAKQSHIASTLAVRFSLQWIESNVTESPETTDWQELAQHLSYALVDQASRMFGTEKNLAGTELNMATTAICGIVDFSKVHSGGSACAYIFFHWRLWRLVAESKRFRIRDRR